MKFRKKPIVIEAEKVSDLVNYSVHSWYDLPSWIRDNYEEGNIIFLRKEIIINTLEGQMTASHDDWIIKGVNQEIYPCKPEIFEKTYESVEE